MLDVRKTKGYNMSTSANFKVKNGLNVNGQIVSALAIGTAPFAVTSTTLNTNLNADLLDGQHGSYYLDYNNLNNKPTQWTSIAYNEDLTTSSTTSTTPQTKIQQTFVLASEKTIVVYWGSQISSSASNKDMRALITVDGNTIAESITRYGTTNPAGGTFYFTGRSYRLVLAAGSHTVLLQYATTATNAVTYISKAHVETLQL